MSRNRTYPKLSIVTPSFNQAEFLEQTICSVLDQQYPNLEYIIIDGGSSDGSVEIIQKYERYLAFWSSEQDRGQYHAINKGFEHSTGEIMAWINSDDMYCPWAFKTVGSIFNQVPGCRWLTTLNAFYWNRDGFPAGIRSVGGYSAPAFCDGQNAKFGSIRSGFIQQESTFWRRDLWQEVGGLDLSFQMAGDFDLWSHFFGLTELYGTVAPLGGFRIHNQNRSLDRDGYLKEVEVSLSRFRQRHPEFRSLVRRILKRTLDHIPVLRRHLKVYWAKNIYLDPSKGLEEWALRNIRF